MATWSECLALAKSELALNTSSSEFAESLLKPHPLVTLRVTENGRSLFANEDIPPFTEILSDTAIAWYPPTCNTLSGTIPGMLTIAPGHTRESLEVALVNMAPYSKDCGCPEASASASLPRGEIYAKVSNFNSLGAMVDEDAPPESRRISLICPVVAMINHSCAPNSSYESFFSKAAGAPGIRVFSECAIPKGEEICISYVPRHLSKAQRKEHLASSYGFVCACPRCTSPCEDTVVWRCGGVCGGKGGVVEGGDGGCSLGCSGRSSCGSAEEREAFLASPARHSASALLSLTSPLHINDQGVFGALYGCLAGLWQGSKDDALKCAAARAVCDGAGVCRSGRGPAFTCDALLIAGHFFSFASSATTTTTATAAAAKAGAVEVGVRQGSEPKAWERESDPHLSLRSAAQAYYTRAAELYRAMYGEKDPRVGIADGLARAPPKTPREAEAAERRRLERSSNWERLYGIPCDVLLQWMKGVPKRSGGRADAEAMRELIALSRSF